MSNVMFSFVSLATYRKTEYRLCLAIAARVRKTDSHYHYTLYSVLID